MQQRITSSLWLGKTFGDEIVIVIEEDTEPREISIPADLRQALQGAPEAEAFFQRLAYTHQKEYVQVVKDPLFYHFHLPVELSTTNCGRTPFAL